MKLLLTRLVLPVLLLIPAASALAQTTSTEIEFWQSVKGSSSAEELEAYLEAYPKGKFAPLARIRLNKLKQDAAPSGAAVAGSAKPPAHDRTKQDANAVLREKTVSLKLGEMPALPGRGVIGMKLFSLSEGIAAQAGLKNNAGVLVYRVVDGMPASIAAIAPGTVVRSIEGRKFDDHYEFLRFMHDYAPGQSVTLRIIDPTKTPSGFATILKRAAEDGDANAMTILALSYKHGRYTKKDDNKAYQMFRKGAERGDALAMANLAHNYYATGKIVAKDDKKAAHWYRKAAAKGNVFAMTVLGDKHSTGRGVLHDDRVAIDWYRKAAEAGNAYGMAAYASMLSVGRGSKKNIPEAIKWYRRAAELGDKQAIKKLEELGVAQPSSADGAAAKAPKETDFNLAPSDLQKLD